MPQLSDLIKKRTDKKFTKKSYRPWDLSGTGTIDQTDTSETTNINTTIPEEHHSHEKSHVVGNISVIETPAKISGNDSDIISDNKQVTTREHTVNNQITSQKQPDNKKVTYREPLDDETDNQLDHAEDIVFLSDSIRKLTGIQQKIFFYVIDLCSSRGLLDTGVILTTDLTMIANCSFGSAKTSLARLIDKRLVIRKKGKASRGGHIILGITKDIQAAALYAQRFSLNPNIKAGHLDNKFDNNLDNNHAYSSSNNYINNNTTKLPAEWDEIDLTSLSHIGFSKTQLLQLYSRQLNTPEIIQESINHFAFALENNKKVSAYPDPLNVFMGVLRKGMNWHEKNYISAKEKALAELLSYKRNEAERINQLEKSLMEEEFKFWRVNLANNEKEQLLGSKPRSNLVSKAVAEKADEGYLLQHFKDNVYKKN